jgi:hypothetical protein fgonA2_06659|nr:MAG TPA: protein of unknown function (DUF4376) [Caudoviricetes sp.]
MNKYVFNKEKAKLNQWQLLDVVNENKEINQPNTCYWVGSEYPSFSMFYDEEKDCIREKTQYEKLVYKEITLQDGEYLNGKEIKYIPRPEQDLMFWHWNKVKWEFDFINWKKSLEQNLFAIRNNAMHKDIEFNNFVFRMLPVDVENFKEKALQVSLGMVQLTDIIEWRLKNDEVHNFTIKDILDILGIWAKRKVDIFEKFNKLYVDFLTETDEDKLRKFMKNIEEEWF